MIDDEEATLNILIGVKALLIAYPHIQEMIDEYATAAQERKETGREPTAAEHLHYTAMIEAIQDATPVKA